MITKSRIALVYQVIAADGRWCRSIYSGESEDTRSDLVLGFIGGRENISHGRHSGRRVAGSVPWRFLVKISEDSTRYPDRGRSSLTPRIVCESIR